MNNLQFGLVAVLLVFGTLSQANHTLLLSQSTDAEKVLVSQAFQQMEEAVIMSSTSGDGLAVRVAIDAIRKAAIECHASGVPATTVKTVVDGILTALRLVLASAQKAYIAIEEANKLIDNPAAAVQAINEGFGADTELIYDIGVPIHDAQGAALVLVGGDAKEGLKNSISSIQKAGNIALKNMESIAQLLTFGIKAGGRAAIEAIQAARESVEAGSLAVLKHLIDSAAYALDALRVASPKALKQANLVPGILDSLKTSVMTRSPAALEAIARLDSGAKSALKVLTKKPLIDAVEVMTEGLKATIAQTADAIAVAKMSLKVADNLVSQDVEAALSVVRRGTAAAQDEILRGSANGYLGLGAAGVLGGVKVAEGLVPAVIEAEYGRNAAFEDLALAERTAFIGILAGGLTAAQGILAAAQTCEAAGNALYTQFADAGDIGFQVMLSL